MLPDDASGCSELVRACIEQDPSLPQPLRAALARRESPEFMAERARLFYVAVCELQGRLAGVGGVDHNEIRMLCVAPECRRHGVGRRLLGHLENLVPPALFGSVFVYASTGAADFYQALGYERAGEHIFPLLGIDYPTLFMVKRLAGMIP